MCRMTFAAVAALAAYSPLHAQQVPGRDLFDFRVGTIAEAPALATAAGGGFWNPATISLARDDRFLFSASALNSPIEQSVSAQLGTAAFRVRKGITAGISVAQASVTDIPRTDTDPQSIGDAEYRSTILSAMVAAERGPATFGVALRRRSGTADIVSGSATSLDVGATVDRPFGAPVRAAASSFLLSPSTSRERASVSAAAEGYVAPAWNDLRAGLSYQRDRGAGSESFAYASARASYFNLRGGLARESQYGASTTRLRLGVEMRYSHYLVGVSREEGTAGLGATYQFLLTTVVTGAMTR